MEKQEITIQIIIVRSVRFFKLAKKKWWVFLLAALLFGSLGYFFAARKGTNYQVEATLGVKGGSWGGGTQSSALSLASQFGFSLGSYSAFQPDNKTIIGVSLSRQNIKTCLLEKCYYNKNKTCLATEYLRINKLLQENQTPYQFKSVDIYNILPEEDSLLDVIYDRLLKNNLTLNLDEDLGMVKLKVNSNNPFFSQQFSYNILSFVNRFFVENQEVNQSKSYQVSKRRTDSIYTVLKIKEAQLAQLSDVSINSIKTSGHLQQMQLTRDVELLNKIYAEAIATLELNKVVLGQDKSVMLVIDDPKYSMHAMRPDKKIYTIVFALIGLIITSLGLIFITYYKNEIRPVLENAKV